MITAHSSIDTCKQAINEGAYDYIEKPIDLDLLRSVVKRAMEKVELLRENQRLQDRLEEKFDFSGVVGESPRMLRLLEKLRRAAASDVTVLIQGQSGAGKELFGYQCASAFRIHRNFLRSTMIPIRAIAMSKPRIISRFNQLSDQPVPKLLAPCIVSIR